MKRNQVLLTMPVIHVLGMPVWRSTAEVLILNSSPQTKIAANATVEFRTTETAIARTHMEEELRILIHE